MIKGCFFRLISESSRIRIKTKSRFSHNAAHSFSALRTAYDEKSLFPSYIREFENKMKNYHAMALSNTQVNNEIYHAMALSNTQVNNEKLIPASGTFFCGEGGGSVVEHQTTELEDGSSKPSSAMLCP